MAKRTFKSLLSDLIGAVTASPVPVKSVEYDPGTKRIKVEFDREPAVVAAPPPAATVAMQAAAPSLPPQADPTKYIPGTDIPDDDTPVDALTLAMARPRYELDATNGVSGGDRGQ